MKTMLVIEVIVKTCCHAVLIFTLCQLMCRLTSLNCELTAAMSGNITDVIKKGQVKVKGKRLGVTIQICY